MTHYQLYMQQIHNAARAQDIENGVKWVIEDVVEYLVKAGVKPDSNLIKEIRSLRDYQYVSREYQYTGNKIKINGF